MSSITDSLALVGVPSAPFAPPRAGLLRDQELLVTHRLHRQRRERVGRLAQLGEEFGDRGHASILSTFEHQF